MSPSLFKDDAARERMEAWYDRVREAIPAATTTRTLETSFGATHVLSAGAEDAPPLVALHGAMANSALLLRELWHLTKQFRLHVVDVLGQSVKSADAALPVKGDAHGRWVGRGSWISWGSSAWPCSGSAGAASPRCASPRCRRSASSAWRCWCPPAW
jgi:hypothetical protein